MAAGAHSLLYMTKYRVLDWYVSFSNFDDPAFHTEVAYFIFNLVTTSKDEQMEILLERGALAALSNVIREEYSTEAILFGLKAL